MARRRVLIRDWAGERGCYSGARRAPDERDDRATRVEEAVIRALGELGEEERELLQRHYYMGETDHQLAERTGRAVHKLTALRKRALVRLRRQLRSFMAEEFGLVVGPVRHCPLCRSPRRAEIDRIIRSKPDTETWGRTLRLLRSEFGLTIKSPQAIIGHLRYH